MLVRVVLYLKIFATRKSSWFMRSRYKSPGLTTLKTRNGAAENPRPSVEAVMLHAGLATGEHTLAFATTLTPGSFWSVPLTKTSILGMVYDASPLTPVR